MQVKSKWCYFYRGIYEDGNLVDVRLSEKRDTEAIAEELGTEVEHEVRSCLGNLIEQSHRGIKQRYYPALGFGAFESAKRFCQVFDEVKQFLRPRAKMGEFVSLLERRERLLTGMDEL